MELFIQHQSTLSVEMILFSSNIQDMETTVRYTSGTRENFQTARPKVNRQIRRAVSVYKISSQTHEKWVFLKLHQLLRVKPMVLSNSPSASATNKCNPALITKQFCLRVCCKLRAVTVISSTNKSSLFISSVCGRAAALSRIKSYS